MWNFKGILWNSTQIILPIHWKIWFLCNFEILRALRLKSLYAFLKRPPVPNGFLWSHFHALGLCSGDDVTMEMAMQYKTPSSRVTRVRERWYVTPLIYDTHIFTTSRIRTYLVNLTYINKYNLHMLDYVDYATYNRQLHHNISLVYALTTQILFYVYTAEPV